MRNTPGRPRQRPRVIGLLGPVAAGKSTVARLMAEGGAELVDADQIAHEVLQRAPVREQIRQEFGEEVFQANGTISRQRLGRFVFEDAERRRRLNRIVHPPILAEIDRRMRESQADLLVLDAPLLLEVGLANRCEVLVFVDAEQGQRRRRALKSRGWKGQELALRDAAQVPGEQKKARAEFVLDNNGTLENLAHQVRLLLGRLRT